jgi:hypothetical protein
LTLHDSNQAVEGCMGEVTISVNGGDMPVFVVVPERSASWLDDEMRILHRAGPESTTWP